MSIARWELYALILYNIQNRYKRPEYFYKYAFDLVRSGFALQIWAYRNRYRPGKLTTIRQAIK
jgi:hypothetical protein